MKPEKDKWERKYKETTNYTHFTDPSTKNLLCTRYYMGELGKMQYFSLLQAMW